MGSTGEGGGVDAGPGSIVWVRRRNGSWWPGRILGPEELAASHLMSPRSGTPVKLLGREDASVDWYNLEKSKRVKAFRCGEFDDCIEKAEASVGLPSKKREKYARREDAILHALELEKQYMQKCGKLVRPHRMKEASSEPERKLLAAKPHALENGNGMLGNHVVCQVDRKVNLSTTLVPNGIPLHAPKVRDYSHPSLEEHNIGMSSHVRGLSDAKLKAVPMNRMFYSAASEDPNRTAYNGHVYDVMGSCPGFENSSDSESRNFKGKRSLESYVEESALKRHRGQHSCVNMLQNSAELPDSSLRPELYMKGLSGDGVNHYFMYMPTEPPEMFDAKPHPQDQMEMPVSRLEVGTRNSQHDTFAEQTSSGSSEETESDSSETHSLEPPVEPGMLLSDAETRIRPQSRFGRMDMQPEQECTSSDYSDELLHDGRSQFHIVDPSTSGSGVSKWQLKRKRNVRSTNKTPINKMTQRTYHDEKGRSLNQRATSHSQSYFHDNGYTNDSKFVEEDIDPHTHGFGRRGCMPPQAASRRQSYVGQNMIDWEELAWGRPIRGYWEELGGFFSPMYVRNGHDMLIDVDLKVQASRQGQHVPWVSLMSKLNGKAIIGHPIQIEPLEDGSTDIVFTTSNESIYDSDRGRVPPMWSTARRTSNFRVPHSNHPCQLDGDEDSDPQHLHPSAKVWSKKPLTPHSVRKGNSLKKNHAHGPRSPLGMKKPPRKGGLPSNQKTKPLSSFGSDQKFANHGRDDNTSYCMDGGIKPANSAPPTVACIPVKLVFSRLLEAVGRPPSGLAKHRVSVNSK